MGVENGYKDITNRCLSIGDVIRRRSGSRRVLRQQIRWRLPFRPLAQDHTHGSTEADLLDKVIVAALEVDDPADILGGRGFLSYHDETPFFGC